MTQQEINENNKLIAEFIGLKIQTDGISLFDENFNTLKRYDKDWNSLMQVVEKIEECDAVASFQIEQQYLINTIFGSGSMIRNRYSHSGRT